MQTPGLGSSSQFLPLVSVLVGLVFQRAASPPGCVGPSDAAARAMERVVRKGRRVVGEQLAVFVGEQRGGWALWARLGLGPAGRALAGRENKGLGMGRRI